MLSYRWVVLDFVFFFKQKTAYEMRISDWSSDVCSSDLPRLCERGRHGAEIPRFARAATARDRALRFLALHRGAAQRLYVVPQPYLDRHRPRAHRHAALRVRRGFRL